MLKLKLTKDEVAKLPAAFQAEYREDGDAFVLDTDVAFEDVTPLKTALKGEKEHRRTATTKVTELEAQIATATEELTTLKARAGQPSDLEKSWQAKLDKATADYKAEKDNLTAHIQRSLVDNVAQSLASEISTAPAIILPHIKARLRAEQEDGEFLTRVLDSDGKASALSVNELRQEFLANKDFASIIKASQASGGGASGGKRGAGGKAFKDMTEAERVALYKSDVNEYRRLKAASASVTV